MLLYFYLKITPSIKLKEIFLRLRESKRRNRKLRLPCYYRTLLIKLCSTLSTVLDLNALCNRHVRTEVPRESPSVEPCVKDKKKVYDNNRALKVRGS